MKLLQDVAGLEDFKLLLESPVIAASKKNVIFDGVLASRISKLTLDFLKLLTKNKREASLKDIARNYLATYRKSYHITAVHLTLAQKTDAKFLKEIEDSIAIRFKTKVELTSETDETLIGGFIIRMEDEQFDGSASNKLKQIEKSLLGK